MKIISIVKGKSRLQLPQPLKLTFIQWLEIGTNTPTLYNRKMKKNIFFERINSFTEIQQTPYRTGNGRKKNN